MTQRNVQRGDCALTVLQDRALIKQNLGPTVGKKIKNTNIQQINKNRSVIQIKKERRGATVKAKKRQAKYVFFNSIFITAYPRRLQLAPPTTPPRINTATPAKLRASRSLLSANPLPHPLPQPAHGRAT
jgi:hypothetical protein